MKLHVTDSKSLRLTLWVAQLVLALMFGMAGWMKSTMAPMDLALYVPWSPDVPLWLVRFIGIAEFAGALGLVLPALTRVKPFLTPLAAALLTVVMGLALFFHVVRGEGGSLLMPLVLGLIAAFVAWGRHRKAPIAPRA